MEKLWGQSLIEKIKNYHVLIVGVGGIGCELLKGLVKLHFKSYHLVNYSTSSTWIP